MDGGAWWAAVHGVSKSQTRLSDFTFTFHFHTLEKEMATHSSVLAWRIPGTGQPGGLQSMGSHRVGHDWSDLAAAAFPIMSLTKSKTVREKKKNQVPTTQPYLGKWISYSLVRLMMLIIASCSFWKPWSTSSLTNSSRSTIGSYPMLCAVSPWFQ